MDIDDRLKKIINIIEAKGYQTLIVGGAVRNFLLNLDVVDYDLATSASLSEVSKLFLDTSLIYRNNVEWALKITYEGFKCEISSFRIEEDYSQRIPQTMISVPGFKKDVLRRDFTINAIGYSLSEGYLDYTNGLIDIENKIVRVIGNPKLRFNEDPIRMLRGLRLAATLDFSIEENTLKEIKEMYSKALNISSAHVANELKRILSAKNFDYVYDVLPALFSDISEGKFKNIHLKDRSVLKDIELLYVYLTYVVKLEQNNPMIKLLGIKDLVIEKFNKLNDLMVSLLKVTSYEMMVFSIISYGKNNVEYVINVLNALNLLSKSNYDLFNEINLHGYLKIDELEVGPDDINLNISIKEKYRLLEILQKEVIANKILNEKELLLKRIKTIIK